MNFSDVLKALKNHKNKIIIGFISIFVFLFLFFPFSDLSTLITSEVAKLTQNEIFLQLDELKLKLFPSPGVDMSKVSVDIGQLPTIKADEVSVRPSPSVIFTQTPAGTFSAKGIFKGNMTVQMSGGKKTESGLPRQKIEIKADQLNLADLKDFKQIPLLLKGQLSIQGNILADLSFSEQPDADIEIQAEKFEIPSQAFQTAMGPMNLPDLKLGKIQIKGKLIDGRLNIEEGKIGQEGDDIHGQIKGQIALLIRNQNGILTEPGAYSFDLDLNFRKETEDKLNTFLGFISQFKTPTLDGSRYRLKLSAQNPYFPPTMGALR